ncbi:MAG: hypothetical protein KAG66_06185 [Methylococcales bacterium]|nr:hypothetical protein [Methylococcales bacterium]
MDFHPPNIDVIPIFGLIARGFLRVLRFTYDYSSAGTKQLATPSNRSKSRAFFAGQLNLKIMISHTIIELQTLQKGQSQEMYASSVTLSTIRVFATLPLKSF